LDFSLRTKMATVRSKAVRYTRTRAAVVYCSCLSGEARDSLWRSGSRPRISSTHGPHPLSSPSPNQTRPKPTLEHRCRTLPRARFLDKKSAPLLPRSPRKSPENHARALSPVLLAPRATVPGASHSSQCGAMSETAGDQRWTHRRPALSSNFGRNPLFLSRPWLSLAPRAP